MATPEDDSRALEQRKRDVIRAVRRAFGEFKLPESAVELTGVGAGQGLEEPYVLEHFLGKTRSDVENAFLPSLHMEDFSYMSKQGVGYYLPAVLGLMLDHPDDSDLWIYLSGFLRRRADELPWLSAAQCHVISEWADCLLALWDDDGWECGIYWLEANDRKHLVGLTQDYRAHATR